MRRFILTALAISVILPIIIVVIETGVLMFICFYFFHEIFNPFVYWKEMLSELLRLLPPSVVLGSVMTAHCMHTFKIKK